MTKSPFEFLRDSAVITTGLAVLLFVWGSSFQSFSAQIEGVPLVFLPELTVQEHMLSGGFVALFIFVPTLALILIVNQLAKGRISSYIRKKTNDSLDAFICYAVALALSIGILYLVALAFSYFRSPYSMRVQTMRLASGPSTQLEGLSFVTRRGGNYVFVNRTGPKPVITVLHVDEMKVMTLAPDDSKSKGPDSSVTQTPKIGAKVP